MEQKYSRQQYMDGEVNHADYYAQWVTPGTRAFVLRHIGKQRILDSKDEHFNDIPLALWDKLAESVTAGDNSLCARVCKLKEAARQIRSET